MKANKTIKNAGWLIGCKVIQSVLAFLISSLTARYLGPSNYGIINYATSLVVFVAPLMYLGLNSTLVQEVVSHPEKEGESLGTSLGLNLLSSVFCIIGIISFVSITSSNEKETIIVCSLYGLTLFAQALEIIQYWFHAKLLSKYMAIVSVIAYGIISVYKIFLLATGKSVYWFAVSNALDYAIIAVTLIVIYHKMGNQRLRFSWTRAKEMLSVSKYYIASNMMIAIFSHIDRILLKHLVDETATGFYAAAAYLSGVTTFVFTAVIDSARPYIFSSKKVSQEHFEHNVKRLYCIIIYLALAQCLVVSLGSKWIVNIIYGASYTQTANILSILVWQTLFSYIGGAHGVWILAENKQRYLFSLNLSGAIMNICLNCVLIPVCGVLGAAIASVTTQIFTNIVMVFLIKPIRRNVVLTLQAFNFKYIYELLCQLILKRKR